MIGRRIKTQLTAFVVIALLGTTYVGGRYAGLDRMFTDRGYEVAVRLAVTGGLFTHAEVTYRGVGVGRVGPMRLTRDGIEARVRIDDSAPPIPRDVEVVVANRSAVGEQYVDLRPRTRSGPFLAEGSVIRQDRTATPLPTERVLASLDGFAASVPQDSLRTVVDELGTALADTGPDLQVLLDTTGSFTRAAADAMPEITALLRDGRTVLETQHEQSDALRSFAADARLVAEQLRSSDGDLRELLRTAPAAARQVSGVLRDNDPNLGVLVANLITPATVLVQRQDELERVLVAAPRATAMGEAVFQPGGARFGLVNTFFDPLPCTEGYGATPRRGGLDVEPGVPWNQQAGCTVPR